MFIVKFYTIQLVIFSGFLNYTYAMIDRSEKHPQSVRSDRQFRPVLNSIIFLIAANLVAKGALGLGGYQAPTIPSNVQGSLYLTLNAPNTHQGQHQQIVPLPVWFPLGASSTQQPRPITQTQIVNIGEPFEETIEEYGKTSFFNDGEYSQKFINRYNSIEDPLEVASSNEQEVKTKPDDSTTEANTEATTTLDPDVEILPQNFTNTDVELVEVARQLPQNISTTTQRPTTTTTTTTEEIPTVAAPTGSTNASTNASLAGNNTNGYGYGPSHGYENISITYGPPNGPNITGNISHAGNHTNTTGYSYLPAGDYGPYTGNENISITYGPPVYRRPVYQKPFFSSPEDPYLNSYNQHYYNNFYDQTPSYFTDMFKYNNFFKNFYNKFDYNNNYPSFYNNYLGK